MQAVVVRKFGQIESLLIEELPDPVPGPDEVLVEIRATAANFVDLLVISGRYQFLPETPFTPGKLPVGVVTQLGTDVTTSRVGDRVLCLAEHGGYAQKVSIAASQCFRLPDSLSFVDGAAMATLAPAEATINSRRFMFIWSPWDHLQKGNSWRTNRRACS